MAPWKRVDDMQAALPARDLGRIEREGGVITREEYEESQSGEARQKM
jgi:hypothetical protein